ncbi:MAG: glycosyltransferase family 39 protein [Xenococcaceae cyanobacterium MO_167.B27]|nr:glycosyltransferase family 39 protein [Xenococcaceae cyanobacterium MO_167.B27]
MLAEQLPEKIRPHTRYFPNWLRFLLTILIALGIFLRFSNLDIKVFWVDEVINSHYSSGYREIDIGNQVKAWNGQDISIQELHRFQSPNSETNSIDVIKALAIEEPQSPPLYYLLLRWWMQLFGDSVAVRRSLSAICSLLAFPCLYWLCWELFRSSLTGWIAMALLAVSPFHLIYAQEVRYYAAWTVLILLSSAVFLWAIRHQKKWHWSVYAIALSTGFYTYPLTGFVAISHGIYIVVLNKFRLTKSVINYLLALSASIISFLPWIIFLVQNSHKMSKWRQVETSLVALIKHWISCLEIVFWDFHKISLANSSYITSSLLDDSLKIFLLIIIGYAIYYLYRYTPKATWLFVLTITIVPWLILILPDLIVGGIRSTIPRYLIPSYLAIQLTLAYLFASKLDSKISSIREQNLWRIVMSIMISISLISCIVISQSEVWWNKSNNVDNPSIARIINQAYNPVLIGRLTEDSGRSIISLTYDLDPKVRLQLIYDELSFPKISSNFKNIFIYSLSDELRYKLETEQNFKPELIHEGKRRSLWKLNKNNDKLPL